MSDGKTVYWVGGAGPEWVTPEEAARRTKEEVVREIIMRVLGLPPEYRHEALQRLHEAVEAASQGL